MLSEINKDFYCFTQRFHKDICEVDEYGKCRQEHCINYHHKWPTLEQFEKEYGEEYPEGGAMYFFESSWWPTDKANALANMEYYKKMGYKNGFAVCACTPFGNPDKNWRPQ